jgi:hypothetical protein
VSVAAKIIMSKILYSSGDKKVSLDFNGDRISYGFTNTTIKD